jgi:hypothetical protein
VDVAFPPPPIFGRGEVRADFVEQRKPLVVGKIGEPSHRGVEGDDPFAIG